VCLPIFVQQAQQCDFPFHHEQSPTNNEVGLAVLDNLAQWVADEAQDKLCAEDAQAWAGAKSWPKAYTGTIPHQDNGSDCGVFLTAFASQAALFKYGPECLA
jgi:Ulp1 family protease